MTTLREAAQQALEAWDTRAGIDTASKAFEALRAALAEPVEPLEPVAWMIYTLDGKSVCVTDNPADFTNQHRALPLYTAPPQRKPLTDEEMLNIIDDTLEGGSLVDVARAIERAHGIGEQP